MDVVELDPSSSGKHESAFPRDKHSSSYASHDAAHNHVTCGAGCNRRVERGSPEPEKRLRSN
jgi:hypothetical protein